MKNLTAIFDSKSKNTLGLNWSDSVNSVSLAANVAESITIPTGAKYVQFSGTANYYVSFTGTATVPGDVTTGTACVLNPGLRSLDGATSLSVISDSAAVITAEFWS